MKKILILMLALAPVFAFAQERGAAPTADRGVKSRSGGGESAGTIYAEFIAFEQQNRTIVRMTIDKEAQKVVTDKNTLVGMTKLADRVYGSVIEALNAASAQGWKLVANYTTEDKNGTVQHFIIANEVASEAPMREGAQMRNPAPAGGASPSNDADARERARGRK